MEIQVPLNKLRFGQDAGAGINARVAGRLEGIEALAANIFARGQIENLVVKLDGDFYAVSNGNRRLAAFHQMYGADSGRLINCTLREVDETGAFEDSLATAVLAQQLHPVDQYEAFATLKERGSTEEEIAQRYGMKLRQVQQAMALGNLAPAVRDAWRKNEIKTEAAQGFTIAGDYARQERGLDRLRQEFADPRFADASDVKSILEIERGAGALIEFVGIDAYVARGGVVTQDLFGCDHQISDEKLAQQMADERIERECEALVAAGWAFAVSLNSITKNHHDYGYLPHKDAATEAEKERLQALRDIFDDDDGGFGRPDFGELTLTQQEAYLEYLDLKRELAARSFSAKDKKKGGCFVGVDDNGHLDIAFGRSKPAEVQAAAPAGGKIVQADEADDADDADEPRAAAAAAPEPTDISNALRERLMSQLAHGTRDAVQAAIDTDLIKSPLAQVLAKIVALQINADAPHHTPHGVMNRMKEIREAMPAGLINAAILKRFDAEDYFKAAPKPVVIKAIAEAINTDEARKIAGKTRADIAKFAILNIGNRLGWVPKEMRSPHYAGPKPAPAAAAGEPKAVKSNASKSNASKSKVAKSNAAKPKAAPARKAAAAKAVKAAKPKAAKKKSAKKKA